MNQNKSENVTKLQTLQLFSANTNEKSQIVLNDLRLLELVYMYPFLFSKSMLPQNDKDYEEWGWEAITKEFNSSYKGLILSKPFTVEELRCRWAVLQTMCSSFRPNLIQLSSPLFRIIQKIRQLIFVRPTTRVTAFTPTSLLILNQLPLVEQLSQVQQRQLEVEVLDAIFREEQISRSVSEKLNDKDKQNVERECKEFMNSMRIKDVLENIRSQSSSIGSKSPDRLLAPGNNKDGGDFDKTECILHPIQPLIINVEESQDEQQQQPLRQDEQQQEPQQQLPEDEQQELLPKAKKHEKDHEKSLPLAEQEQQPLRQDEQQLPEDEQQELLPKAKKHKKKHEKDHEKSLPQAEQEQQQLLRQDEQQQEQQQQLPEDEQQELLPKAKKRKKKHEKDHEKSLPQAEQREQQTLKDKRLEQPLSQGGQQEKPLPKEQQELQKRTAAQSQASASQHPVNSQMQYVPLESVKYYVKNVKVRIRRLKLREFLPRATKRKRRHIWY